MVGPDARSRITATLIFGSRARDNAFPYDFSPASLAPRTAPLQ
jgi:hypothetical protein